MKRYNNIIEAGYCEAYYLLYYIPKTFYTSGSYGWNADIYHLKSNVALVTGYIPFGNLENHKMLEKYNKEAEKIIKSKDVIEEEKRNLIDNLLEKFIEEILKEED